ncbi:MAG: carbohydrate ABC transporter permease [Candidatus Scatosoma sp.]
MTDTVTFVERQNEYGKDFEKKAKNAKRNKILQSVFINLGILIIALLVLFPFYVMITTSLKSFGEAMYFSWWPSEVSLDAFTFILVPNEQSKALDLNLLRSLRNTLIAVVPGTTVGIFVSAASGYIFAKFEFSGKNIMFSALLFSMMIPGAVMMVSMYLIYAKMNWVDTLLPLIVPQLFGTASLVFAFRQYMYGIPTELVEAARIDGASQFTAFVRVVFPLAKPVMMAHWLLTFMVGYNQYTEPLLYIFDPKWETLQLTLARYSQTIGTANMPVVMAAATISMIPLIILYACSQKFFAAGIMTGALKG